jgi:hypothetical protein
MKPYALRGPPTAPGCETLEADVPAGAAPEGRGETLLPWPATGLSLWTDPPGPKRLDNFIPPVVVANEEVGVEPEAAGPSILMPGVPGCDPGPGRSNGLGRVREVNGLNPADVGPPEVPDPVDDEPSPPRPSFAPGPDF